MTMSENDSDKNAPADVRIVEINREPVELYKILKFEGMVSSGGEGKVVVAAGQVQVNGKVETQKRKKIVTGDTIEFNNEKIGIKLSSAVTAEVVTAEVVPPKTKAEPVVATQIIEETSNSSGN